MFPAILLGHSSFGLCTVACTLALELQPLVNFPRELYQGQILMNFENKEEKPSLALCFRVEVKPGFLRSMPDSLLPPPQPQTQSWLMC